MSEETVATSSVYDADGARNVVVYAKSVMRGSKPGRSPYVALTCVAAASAIVATWPARLAVKTGCCTALTAAARPAATDAAVSPVCAVYVNGVPPTTIVQTEPGATVPLT